MLIKYKKIYTSILFMLLLTLLLLRDTIIQISLIFPIAIVALILIVLLWKDFFYSSDTRTVLFLFFLYFLWCSVTIFWSPQKLFSFARVVYGLLMVTTLLLSSQWWYKNYSNHPFRYLTILNIIVLFSCFFSLIFEVPENAWIGTSADGFKGFFSHQNVLGAELAITSMGIFYEVLTSKNKARIFFFIQLILNVIIIIATYSRGSLLFFCIVIVSYFLFKYRLKAGIPFLISSSLIMFFILFNSNLSENFSQYVSKGYDSVFATRIGTYSYSYEGAKLGGLSGLGYGISHVTPTTDAFIVHADEFGVLRREKSSSVLGLIEEVGIIGLIFFLLPIFYVFISLFKKSKNSFVNKSIYKIHPRIDAIYLAFCVLIAFSIYAQIEAVWIGISSFRFSIFIIIIGVSVNIKQDNSKEGL